MSQVASLEKKSTSNLPVIWIQIQPDCRGETKSGLELNPTVNITQAIQARNIRGRLLFNSCYRKEDEP